MSIPVSITNNDLAVEQGTDWTETITLSNDDGTAVNIAGYVFSGAIKSSYYTQTTLANLTFTYINVAAGVVQVSLNAATTTNIQAGTFIYDVLMLDTTNTTTKIMTGLFRLNPTATGNYPSPP